MRGHFRSQKFTPWNYFGLIYIFRARKLYSSRYGTQIALQSVHTTISESPSYQFIHKKYPQNIIMATAKLAYQTRFSVPNQLDTPQASFGHFGTLPHQQMQINAQHQIKQAEVTRLNAPVSKVLANFDQKAEQLRTFYESTNNQVRWRKWTVLRFLLGPPNFN